MSDYYNLSEYRIRELAKTGLSTTYSYHQRQHDNIEDVYRLYNRYVVVAGLA
jgi:hypothetical protein